MGNMSRGLSLLVLILVGCSSSVPDFILADLGDLKVVLGQQVTKVVSLERKSGLSDAVALSLEKADGTSLPAGITATFDPASVSGNSSALTLKVASSVITGKYNLRVKGIAGNLSKTASLQLNVQPVPATTVSFRTLINSSQQNATWVVYQNGTDAWQLLTGTGGNYQFDVNNPKGKYGVAVVCPTTLNSTDLAVLTYHFTVTETTSFRVTCGSYYGPPAIPGNLSLSGTISGLTGSAVGSLSIGTTGISSFFLPITVSQASPSYAFTNLASGNYNLAASRHPSGSAGQAPDRVIFLRNFSLNGNIVRNLDFEGSQAFALEGSYTATIAGGTADSLGVGYIASTSSSVGLGGVSNQGSVTFQGIPATQSKAGDFYVITASVRKSGLSLYKSTLQFFDTPKNTTLTLPTDMTSSFDFSQTTPNLRPKVSWNLNEPAQLMTAQYIQLSTSSSNNLSWLDFWTPSWLEGASEYTSPDLGSLPGWQNAWSLQKGRTLD